MKKNREGTHTNTHIDKNEAQSDDGKTSSQWANTSLVTNVPSTDDNQGDFHQPRGGGTSDEQGELDTRIQDRHFTLLCGEHRSHRSLTFHIYITTTVTQTQKKKKKKKHT